MDEQLSLKVLQGAGIDTSTTSKVTSSEEESPGLSYSSVLKRFKISYTEIKSNNTRTLSVISKINPETNHSNDSLFDTLFSSEIMIYRIVLPAFQRLFTRTGDSITWPQMYTIIDESKIILEDLKPNYHNNLSDNGSTLEEAVLAIKSLAKFHAASMVAKSEGTLPEHSLEPYFYCRQIDSNNSFLIDGLRILSTTIRRSWSPDYIQLADKLDYIIDNMSDIFMELFNETQDKFKVINHGDMWRANLMFKYDSKNKPVLFKFVDFQLSHYGSLAWDLTYFFFLNPNLSIMYSNYNELMGLYCKNMVDYLDSSSSSIIRLTEHDLHNEFDRLILFGFLKCCTDLPYQLRCHEGGVDAENIFTYNENTDQLKMKMYTNEQYTNIIKRHYEFLISKNAI